MTTTALTHTEVVDVLAALDVLADQYDDRAEWNLGDRQHWADHAARLRDLYDRVMHADTVTITEADR